MNKSSNKKNVQKDVGSLSGVAAENRRVRQHIQNILTISSDSVHQIRKDKPEEFKAFRDVCSEMAKENSQWARVLILELPLENLKEFEPAPSSTLKACFPINDRFKNISLLEKTQSEQREKFFKLLYNSLSDEELETYRNIFEVYSEGWLKGEPGIAKVLDEIEGVYLSLYMKKEHRYRDIHPECDILPPEVVSKLSIDVAEELSHFIETVCNVHHETEFNTLASKLVVNSVINRVILEMDELHRLNIEAFQHVNGIVSLLEHAFEFEHVHVDNDEEIWSVLKRAFTLGLDDEIPEQWNNLPESMRSTIFSRSSLLLEEYCKKRSLSQYNHFKDFHSRPVNKLLMAACLCWDFCMGIKHDSRVIGVKHKNIRFMHSRSDETIDDISWQVRVNIFRQYGLLFYSGQFKILDHFELLQYWKSTLTKRVLLRNIYVQNLKTLSLAQWSSIYDSFLKKQ